MSEVIKVEIVQKILLTVSGYQVLRCFVQGTCIKTHTMYMLVWLLGIHDRNK